MTLVIRTVTIMTDTAKVIATAATINNTMDLPPILPNAAAIDQSFCTARMGKTGRNNDHFVLISKISKNEDDQQKQQKKRQKDQKTKIYVIVNC
uniref:Uncharacterized protein n=1 Tax=Romanomermis culicivorax TaxID=13658 RepID=A0A915IBA9_ROMCU